MPTDNPTLEELNRLPYLECVIRETLRLYAPVTAVGRVAAMDDVLPLSEPLRDSKGNVVAESLLVKKGQIIRVPIIAVNRLKDIWGEDALEFKYVASAIVSTEL